MTSLNPLALIEVTAVNRVTPHMARVTFGGGVESFAYVCPDQQAKLFFPKPGQREPRVPEPPADGDVMRWYQAYLAMPDAERPWMRSYSIRAHRPDTAEIDIDFVLHGDTGPASAWASRAAPGDVLGLLGPAASHYRTAAPEDHRVYAGDETALPAIGAALEALPADASAVAYVEVAGAEEEQKFDTVADVTVHWLYRGEAAAGTTGLLLDAVGGADLPARGGFAWLAGEAATVRALRRHLVDERGIAKKAIAFAGYWRLGATQDDPATAEDLADSEESLPA